MCLLIMVSVTVSILTISEQTNANYLFTFIISKQNIIANTSNVPLRENHI